MSSRNSDCWYDRSSTPFPLLRGLPIDESQCFLPTDRIDTTRLVVEGHTVALVCHEEHLGPESSADKLATHAITVLPVTSLGALLGGYLFKHLCDRGTVLGVEVGINLIKQVEWCWVALLDREDKC